MNTNFTPKEIDQLLEERGIYKAEYMYLEEEMKKKNSEILKLTTENQELKERLSMSEDFGSYEESSGTRAKIKLTVAESLIRQTLAAYQENFLCSEGGMLMPEDFDVNWKNLESFLMSLESNAVVPEQRYSFLERKKALAVIQFIYEKGFLDQSDIPFQYVYSEWYQEAKKNKGGRTK